MGTRGLVAVMADGRYQIAQYGQWDFYVSGQGVDVLAFCRQHLRTKKDREKFKTKLAQVQFTEDEELLKSCTFIREKEDYSAMMEIGPDGMMHPTKKPITMKKEPYWYCGRDNGADILGLVRDAPEGKTIYLTNEIAFVGDSLFCEYAYVIDLDKNTFEVFKGFNKRQLGKTQRFKDYFKKAEHRGEDQYHPVAHLKTYDLDNLPDKKVFLEELEPKEE